MNQELCNPLEKEYCSAWREVMVAELVRHLHTAEVMNEAAELEVMGVRFTAPKVDLEAAAHRCRALPAEAGDGPLVGKGPGGEELQRDAPPERDLLGLVHDAHAPAPELALEPEALDLARKVRSLVVLVRRGLVRRGLHRRDCTQ
mgnify:CR=1 FL=1